MFALEQKYNLFQGVKSEWGALLKSLLITSDVTSTGITRMVAATDNPALLQKAGALLSEWAAFVELVKAGEQRKINVANYAEFMPVPQLRGGFDNVAINKFSALSSRKMSREAILSMLAYRSVRANGGTIYDREQLKADIANFEGYPAGTAFRIRTGGYRDLTVGLYKDGEEERLRVSQHGLLLDTREVNAVDFWAVNDGSKTAKYSSIYDHLTPINCTLFSGAAVYLEDEVIAVKHERAKARGIILPLRKVQSAPH